LKAQSEAVGALVLAFMIVFMLLGANIILRQQAQVTSYNMKLADLIARRQMENIVFDYRDGKIYATPSTEMDVLAVVAYNDTSVVYVNTSRMHLSVNRWTQLITDPQLASDIYNLKYVLGVITSTGNLLTWMPPVTRIEKATSLLFEAEKPGLRAYIVGNNTSIHIPANYTADYTIYYDPSYPDSIAGYRIILQRTGTLTVWAPVIIFYRGIVDINETWSRGVAYINISSGNSYLYIVVDPNGIRSALSSSNAGPSGSFYVKLYKYLANGAVVNTSISSLSKFRVGDSEVAVVSVAVSGAGSSITVRDLINNTVVFSNVLGDPTSIDTGYVTQPTSVFLNGLIGVYANVSALSTYTSLFGGKGVALAVADLDSPDPSAVSVQLSLSTINHDLYTSWMKWGSDLLKTNFTLSGYVLNPARFVALNVTLRLLSGDGAYRTYFYTFNTTNFTVSVPDRSIYQGTHYISMSYTVALPDSTSVTVSSNLTYIINYVSIYSSPPTSTAPPPPPTTPPSPPPQNTAAITRSRILILQDPLPLNDTR